MERPIPRVRGTLDWLPDDYQALASLERSLADAFVAAGYRPMRLPVLEATELHERKSGAGVVSMLYELAESSGHGVCLRPELTAGVVRAYIEASEPPPLPWRVCVTGPVFRLVSDPGPGQLREFTQAGVELLGAGGPKADAEVIGLSVAALRAVGLPRVSVRIGHVGLVLELFERSGLPSAAFSSLVENLSVAAAEGRGVRELEAALARLGGWLDTADAPDGAEPGGQPGVELGRLFRTLVPAVTGRRDAPEVVARLRRKWELSHSLRPALDRVREQVHALSDLRGPAEEVLARLDNGLAASAPESVAAIRTLIAELSARGVAPADVELDLGFSRGIGFYSQMIFELTVDGPDGPVAVGGGGRYDGLARVLGSQRDDRGVGFALGLERVLMALSSRQASK